MLTAVPQQFRSLPWLHGISQECRSYGWKGERVEKIFFFFFPPPNYMPFLYLCESIIATTSLSSQSLLDLWPFLPSWLCECILYITLFPQGKTVWVVRRLYSSLKHLTAIYLCACQSIWCFYASSVFSSSLFERYIDKELATSTRRKSAK